MDNQIIHKQVMGGCWHKASKEWVAKWGMSRPLLCDKCGVNFQLEGWMNVNPNYSDPINYEALSSKFREWGEWVGFFAHLKSDESKDMLPAWVWEQTLIECRVKLIADYIRSKGVEYWDRRREG